MWRECGATPVGIRTRFVLRGGAYNLMDAGLLAVEVAVVVTTLLLTLFGLGPVA